LAVVNYHDVHGHFPPAYLADAEGRPMHSWRILILPYMEQQELYEQYDFSQPWDGPDNRRLADRMPRIYAFHPTYHAGLTTTNYLAVVGKNTVWPENAGRTSEEITDPHGQTILLVENQGADVHWMEPRDLPWDTMSFSVPSAAGISSPYIDSAVVMADGRVVRLKNNLDPQVLRAMLTVQGGEQLREDEESWTWLSDGRERELIGE
jgi:hypothetical protein